MARASFGEWPPLLLTDEADELELVLAELDIELASEPDELQAS